MSSSDNFNRQHNGYVKRCTLNKACDAYKAALERGHSEEYAKSLFNERYAEYLARNLE